MSKITLTAPVLAIAASATPAAAQEMPWTGLYGGVSTAVVDVEPTWTGNTIYQTVDGAEGSFTVVPHSDAITGKPSSTKASVGGRAGFNFQAGGVVLGGEADATFFGYTGTVAQTGANSTFALVSHVSNLETVRARVGFAAGSALLFATGGAAFSNLKHTLTATNTSQIVIDGGEGSSTVGTKSASFADSASSSTGWTAGGGVELRVGPSLSVVLTVLHVDFGSETLGGSSAPNGIQTKVDTKMLVGTLGLNLSF